MKTAAKSAGDATWIPFVDAEIKRWVCFALRVAIAVVRVLCCRFLPTGYHEHCVTLLEADDDKQPKASQRRLELATWMAAWDGYAIAVVNIWS